MTGAVILTAEEAASRLIRRSDMVACETAFIDCKIEGSQGKLNYSLIGPGVTQSEHQVINLREPHGFNVGAAAMPHGVTNNLHVHYTAEVFVITEGEWLFRWGPRGDDGEVIGRAGDVVSVPTWMFRGFTNLGDDRGWIFSCLGGDDTGGVIWHPDILRSAAKHGLYLSKDNMLVDVGPDGAAPPADTLITPMSDEDMAALRIVTPDAFAERIVAADKRIFSDKALLDAVLPGHASALAPVIGSGMSQDRNAATPIAGPHGFSVEWLKLPAGQSVGPLHLDAKQVLLVRSGVLTIDFNLDAQRQRVVAEPRDVVSLPASVWRTLAAVEDAEIAVLTAGDDRPALVWHDDIVAAAKAAGYAIDPNGCVAPTHLLPMATAA